MNPLKLFRQCLMVVAVLAAPHVLAADGIETRPVKFAKGASSATLKGSIHGRQTIDFTLRAKAGQTMSVTLSSPNAGLAFNVLPPGSSDVAIPEAIERQQWTGALPADGEYKIRTYLPRSAARLGETANFTLTIAINGSAAISNGDSAAARRAGEGSFDATGKIPCAQAKGQPMGQCDFGVARAGGGSATVSVTRPDGRRRAIFFDKGKAVGADLSQADGNMTFRATKQADLYMIQAGEERYEIPEAVVFGG